MNIWDYLFVFGFLSLVAAWAWVSAPRDPNDCPCGECAPEAPTLPPAVIKAMAARERIAQSYDMGAKRKAWARDQDLEAEIYEMIGKVREGDAR